MQYSLCYTSLNDEKEEHRSKNTLELIPAISFMRTPHRGTGHVSVGDVAHSVAELSSMIKKSTWQPHSSSMSKVFDWKRHACDFTVTWSISSFYWTTVFDGGSCIYASDIR
jgi:hypothetical protein